MSPEVADRIAYWEHLSEWAIPAYFVLFGLGALLMVLAVLRGRSEQSGGTLIRSGVFQFGAIILLMLCALSNQTTIDRNRGFIADQERRYDRMMQELEHRTDKEEVLRAQYLYMPVGNSLAYITLGNTGIAADYLWLTSMQYVSGNFRRGHKFEMLHRFYTTMLELDPHWVDALLNAGKILSALEPDRFAVEKFYIQTIVANPGEWRLPNAAGRLFVVPPLNLEEQPKYSDRAVGWLHSAMQCTSFPKDMRVRTSNLLGLLSAEAGYYEAADGILYQQATDRKGDSNFRSIAAHDWMNVRSIRMARELSNMIIAYKRQLGSLPPSLETMLKSGPAAAAAFKTEYQIDNSTSSLTDAFGFEFDYDPQTGKVASPGVNVRKTLTVHDVISTLIAIYRGEHDNRPPKTLIDLRNWVREFYSSPSNPPSAGVKEAIGSDLDPTRCPLGKWDYDPRTGVIALPPYCTAQRLYQRTDDVMNMPPSKIKAELQR